MSDQPLVLAPQSRFTASVGVTIVIGSFGIGRPDLACRWRSPTSRLAGIWDAICSAPASARIANATAQPPDFKTSNV